MYVYVYVCVYVCVCMSLSLSLSLCVCVWLCDCVTHLNFIYIWACFGLNLHVLRLQILGKQFDVPPRNAVSQVHEPILVETCMYTAIAWSQKVSLIDCEEWQLRVRAPPGTYVCS